MLTRHSRFLAWSLLPTLLLAAACSDDDDSSGGSDGGAADAAVSGPLTSQELLQGCVRASACRAQRYAAVANCVDAYFDLYVPAGTRAMWDKIYRCVNAARGDCKKVTACFGGRGACDNTYKAKCEGKVAVTCDLIDSKAYAFDCADANLECAVKKTSTFAAACTPGSCFSSLGPSCKGEVLLTCNDGVLEHTDCAAKGMVCVAGSKTTACVGASGTSCDPKTFTASCDGTKAKTCEGRREHVVDCAKKTLQKTSCKGGSCVVSGSECDYSLNQCDGRKVKACIDGKWMTFDCDAMGLGGCKTTGNASNCYDPALE